MKTRLRRSECVRVHVLSSLGTRAPMYESLSTLAFDFEPEKGIMECAESTASFFLLLLFRVSSGEFIALLLLFIACLSIFNLFVFSFNYWKETRLVRHTNPSSYYFPEKIHSFIHGIYYFRNTFQSAFTERPPYLFRPFLNSS